MIAGRITGAARTSIAGMNSIDRTRPPLASHRQGLSPDRQPDEEMVRLVSTAWGNALKALAQRDPEAWLRSHTHQARLATNDLFMSLPHAQRLDATVNAEYRKAIAFDGATFELALKMVQAIRSYGPACEWQRRSRGRPR